MEIRKFFDTFPVNAMRSFGGRLLIDDYAVKSQTTRLVMLVWLAIIGFPLYYWIWTYLFPQPYENWWLRLLGMIIACPGLLAKRLHKKIWFKVYFFAVLTYALPFFFTFMFLMNGASSVWSQCMLLAIFILFNFDWKLAAFSSLTGVSLAYLAYVLAAGHWDVPSHGILTNIPIIAFAILAAPFVKISRGILAEEKLRGMASALGVISHELRTPLLSVDASASGLKRYLPALVAFYEKHKHLSTTEVVPPNRLAMMETALDRIQTEVQYMNSAINLLLVNSGEAGANAQKMQVFQINDLIRDAIGRYPFENEQQRALVKVAGSANYNVVGNEDLCVMVLFNLLKNALRAIAKGRKGEISVLTESAAGENRLIIRDTGCGIPASELSKIFDRFHSYPSKAGPGIGLAFVRETLEAWGAKIRCHSEENVYTEFVIQFPIVAPDFTSK